MKSLLKKLAPKFVLGLYHRVLTTLAALLYGFPSRKMIVIGVTGTNGKSTTVHLITKILEQAGHVVGYTTTVDFKVGDKVWLNDYKMTMLGRFALQKLLSDMVRAGCHYAVIETSSEGLAQYRHTGIDYDVALFTNLTPEHIESHGSYENYKQAKGALFRALEGSKKKSFTWKESIPKTIIANTDDKESGYYLSFWAEHKIGFGTKENKQKELKSVIADHIILTDHGSEFAIGQDNYREHLIGIHNVYNALAAIATGISQDMGPEQICKALEAVQGVPGRMEWIDEGQPFKVLIDYAPEPASLEACYATINELFRPSVKRIIHILGSAGGGRDTSRRPILGKLAAENADIVIVANEDPYDEDPQSIIDEVAEGAIAGGKEDGKNVFRILDRRDAIIKAFSMARPGDLVLLTGKGAEQAICVASGGKVVWDERTVAREVLKTLKK